METRQYQTSKKTFFIFTISFFTLAITLYSNRWNFLGEEFRIPVQDKHTVIIFERLKIHPFQIEFLRRVKVKHWLQSGYQEGLSENLVESIYDLPPNYGGRTNIKFYKADNLDRIFLEEENKFHIIDLKNECVMTSVKDSDLDIQFCKNKFILNSQEIFNGLIPLKHIF